jgi:hypothetical protein
MVASEREKTMGHYDDDYAFDEEKRKKELGDQLKKSIKDKVENMNDLAELDLINHIILRAGSFVNILRMIKQL